MTIGLRRLLLATVAVVSMAAALGVGLAAFSGTQAAGVNDNPAESQALNPSTQTPVDEALFAGWNLKTWKVPGCKDARAAVQGLIDADNFNVMWQFRAATQDWLGFDADVPDVINTLDELCQGGIVWINVNADGTWSQTP